ARKKRFLLSIFVAAFRSIKYATAPEAAYLYLTIFVEPILRLASTLFGLKSKNFSTFQLVGFSYASVIAVENAFGSMTEKSSSSTSACVFLVDRIRRQLSLWPQYTAISPLVRSRLPTTRLMSQLYAP